MAEEAAATSVRVERAAKKNYTDSYTVMGTIRGATENELRFEIEGTLLRYNFAEGAKISKGAIIALMPLALGIGTGAQLHQPLAISVIGGFIIALPLLLVVFPSMLRLLYRRRGDNYPLTVKE